MDPKHSVMKELTCNCNKIYILGYPSSHKTFVTPGTLTAITLFVFICDEAIWLAPFTPEMGPIINREMYHAASKTIFPY